MGVPAYKLDYDAIVEFSEDCRWGSGGPNGWRGDFTVYSPEKESPLVEMASMPRYVAKKGSRTTVKGFAPIRENRSRLARCRWKDLLAQAQPNKSSGCVKTQ
jgi:hypothetical protein